MAEKHPNERAAAPLVVGGDDSPARWVRDVTVNTVANLIAVSIIWLVAQAFGVVRSSPALNALAGFVIGMAFLAAIYIMVPVASVRAEQRGNEKTARLVSSLPYIIVIIGEIGALLALLGITEFATVDSQSPLAEALLLIVPFAFVASVYVVGRMVRNRMIGTLRPARPYGVLQNLALAGAILVLAGQIIESIRR